MAGRVPTEAQITADVESVLRELVPGGWGLEVDRKPVLDDGLRPDLVVTVTAPAGERAVFVGEIKRDAAGPQLLRAFDQLRSYTARLPGSLPMFVAPWISERSRERLVARGISYLDTTGNARIAADLPGLLISTAGDAKNPWPIDKSLRSLRGSGAARAVRALADFTPPYGVRELASHTNASPATLSRVIDLLERDGLVERDERGAILDNDWAGTIRRWAQDYDVMRINHTVSYLQPRGLPVLAEALTTSDLQYAATGSLAANKLAPFAPARLAMVYVDDLRKAAYALDLREADTGANVVLLEPYDDVVFARTIDRDGLTLVSPTQLVVDLLTSPGRAPNEGEELLVWMKNNIDAWRT